MGLGLEEMSEVWLEELRMGRSWKRCHEIPLYTVEEGGVCDMPPRGPLKVGRV